MGNLKSLTSNELRNINGGGSVETFTDPDGYEWSYFYDDCGELYAICCSKSMVTIL